MTRPPEETPLEPSSRTLDHLLLVGLVLALAAGLAARVRPIPGLTAPGALNVFLALLALRLVRGVGQARAGELPWGRLLLPGLLFAEGAAALVHPGPAWLWARAATVGCLELTLIVLAVQVWRHAADAPGQWPEERLAQRLEAFLPPRAARMFSVEMVVLAGALRFLAGGWRRQPEPGGFSYHRECTLGAFLLALPLLVLADLLLLEVLLRKLSPWVRWTVHGLDLYGLLWLVGFWSSLRLRPHRIAEGLVHLHRGLMGKVTFPVAQVARVAPVPPLLECAERRAFLGGAVPFGARGGGELLVTLTGPAVPMGLFGPRRPMVSAVVALDDPQAFKDALEGNGSAGELYGQPPPASQPR